MKSFSICLILSIIALFCFAQNSIENKINRIEMSLTRDIVCFDTTLINRMNLYERMKHYKVNGLSIAVIDSGMLQWSKSYGVADISTGDSVTIETVFQTASIGKVITALAALKLVNEGKIALDEDVNNKLTSWKVTENKFTVKEKITLRRLLSHSAGFTDDYGFAGYSPNDLIPLLKDILKAQPPANNLKPLTVNYIPGTQVRYSGGGYLIIQQLIEDLSGITFGEYVEREIFQKLGLKQSTYSFYPDKVNGLKIARGHYEDGKIDPGKKYHVYPEQAVAGYWCTPGDLARILIEIQKENNGSSQKILNRELIHSMLSNQLEFSDRGLGVVLKGAQAIEGFWHSGANAGYNSLMYATTKTGQGAVIMLNSDNGIELAVEITRSIANDYRWPFMQTRLVKKDHPDSLTGYIGSYKSKEGLVVKISQKQEQLQLQFKEKGQSSSSAPLNLYLTINGYYIIREASDLLNFTFSSANGSKTILLEKHGGIEMILKKMD